MMAHLDTALTVLIVAGAAFYLLRRFLRGGKSCGCDCCDKKDSNITEIQDLRDKNG